MLYQLHQDEHGHHEKHHPGKGGEGQFGVVCWRAQVGASV